jgi:hypothetical protein
MFFLKEQSFGINIKKPEKIPVEVQTITYDLKNSFDLKSYQK